jgi:acetolactate synthase-1/3 small subunit
VALEPAFAIVEKTGHEEELVLLLHELKSFGVLEFARSGRVAISKPMKPLINYMNEKQLYEN